MTAARTTATALTARLYYGILDRAPKDRDEGDQPMSWLRRNDEYHNQ
jgi:predicted dithiol-disulfide oxidoreductase (DUF899 family)